MKKGFLLSGVLSLAMLGGGYWLGKRHATQTAPTTANENVLTESSPIQTPALPPVKNSRDDKSAKATVGGKLSLGEIEARIRGLNVNMGRFPDRELMKLLDSVEDADFPQLMAFIDKNVARNERQGLSYQLISHWAETDLPRALAYVQSIPNKRDREAAVQAFVSGWSGKDPQAAAEWAKQFPPGQLRNQLLSQISSVLAATNPQEALDS